MPAVTCTRQVSCLTQAWQLCRRRHSQNSLKSDAQHPHITFLDQQSYFEWCHQPSLPFGGLQSSGWFRLSGGELFQGVSLSFFAKMAAISQTLGERVPLLPVFLSFRHRRKAPVCVAAAGFFFALLKKRKSRKKFLSFHWKKKHFF